MQRLYKHTPILHLSCTCVYMPVSIMEMSRDPELESRKLGENVMTLNIITETLHLSVLMMLARTFNLKNNLPDLRLSVTSRPEWFSKTWNHFFFFFMLMYEWIRSLDMEEPPRGSSGTFSSILLHYVWSRGPGPPWHPQLRLSCFPRHDFLTTRSQMCRLAKLKWDCCIVCSMQTSSLCIP